jgi:hypothetical protein
MDRTEKAMKPTYEKLKKAVKEAGLSFKVNKK